MLENNLIQLLFFDSIVLILLRFLATFNSVFSHGKHLPDEFMTNEKTLKLDEHFHPWRTFFFSGMMCKTNYNEIS